MSRNRGAAVVMAWGCSSPSPASSGLRAGPSATGHGLLSLLRGVLSETGVEPVKADLAGLVRWYLSLWGPFFMHGGIATAPGIG